VSVSDVKNDKVLLETVSQQSCFTVSVETVPRIAADLLLLLIDVKASSVASGTHAMK
jgi:hypothetical protein